MIKSNRSGWTFAASPLQGIGAFTSQKSENQKNSSSDARLSSVNSMRVVGQRRFTHRPPFARRQVRRLFHCRSFSQHTIHARHMSFKFAGIQLDVGADKASNIRRAHERIGEAAKAGAAIVALPECFTSPYGSSFFPAYAESLDSSQTLDMLTAAAKEFQVIVIGGSFPERDAESGKLYNTSVSVDPDGKVIGIHRKVRRLATRLTLAAPL